MQVYADGPSSQTFVEALGERAEGVLGIALFDTSASFFDEDFFGSLADFYSRQELK